MFLFTTPTARETAPATPVVDAIRHAELVVLCPSNPIVSIGPIVSLPGVRNALRAHPRVMAVSPLVNGVPLKGPADKLFGASGEEVSADGLIRVDRAKLWTRPTESPLLIGAAVSAATGR